jgi:hypothetical protein
MDNKTNKDGSVKLATVRTEKLLSLALAQGKISKERASSFKIEFDANEASMTALGKELDGTLIPLDPDAEVSESNKAYPFTSNPVHYFKRENPTASKSAKAEAAAKAVVEKQAAKQALADQLKNGEISQDEFVKQIMLIA